jgi:hypothetical protein
VIRASSAVSPAPKARFPCQSKWAGRPLAELVEAAVGPERAEDAERHRHQEHQVPLHRAEQGAQDEADELAADPGDLVQAERHPAVIGREGVGEDRCRVGQQHGPADGLQDPHRDQPERACGAVQPGHPQQDGEHGEYRETQGVDPHPAEHVAQPAEGHHQHRRDQLVAQD